MAGLRVKVFRDEQKQMRSPNFFVVYRAGLVRIEPLSFRAASGLEIDFRGKCIYYPEGSGNSSPWGQPMGIWCTRCPPAFFCSSWKRYEKLNRKSSLSLRLDSEWE